MTTSAVRIGLVGYGFGGRYFHAPLIAAAPECELHGVVTRSAERRRAAAAEHPGVPAYDSVAELAAAGAEAVAISTPAATHVPLARQAIELGLPVVVDKPFTLDAESARATVEFAERSGVPLTVYQNRRWDSDFATVQRLIAHRELAEVSVSSHASSDSRPTPVRLPPAAEHCWTSAATSSIRRFCSSVRWRMCTPRRGSARISTMRRTTSFSR